MRAVHERIDTLVEKYGRQTVFLGSSLLALEQGLHQNARGMLSYRKLHPLKGEGKKRLAIPYIGSVV